MVNQVINFSFDSGSSNFIEDVFGSVNNVEQTLGNGVGTLVYLYKSYRRTMRDTDLLDGSGSFKSTGEDNFSQDYAASQHLSSLHRRLVVEQQFI